MRTIGLVVAREDSVAEVIVGPHTECRKCGACLAALDEKIRPTRVLNPIQAKVGDTVEVELPPAHAIMSAFLIFLLPLIFAVVGGFFGLRLAKAIGTKPDYLAVISGSAGFVASFVILRYVDRKYARRNMPVVVGIINEG